MEAIWPDVKEIIKNQLPRPTFDLWLEPLRAESGPGGELVLSCPNPFALRWIQANYLKLIRQILETTFNRSLPVHLKLLTAPIRPPAVMPVNQPSLPMVSERPSRRGLNRAFTFDQFVVGASNRLAYQASQALARNDTFYNRILFLTSGPGLGKSHLSQAVGNFISKSAAGRQVLYTTAENFANEMVKALKSGTMSSFKERFRRDCDILLLEEVQFLSGKEKIQAEVCYTLDTLMGQNKRLVFTSCYLPGEIGHLSQELRSRLTGGLITPIGPPDFPTRVNILSTKAQNRGVQVSVRILEYLAEHVEEDVRRLESALDCLVARGTLLNEPFNLGLAREVLQDLKAVETRLNTPAIQKIVGDYYGVSLPELLGRSRQRRLVRARQMALYFCRIYTEKTMVELGRLFQRSHASVVHALQTLERDRKTQPRVAQELQLLEEKMAQAKVRPGSRPASTLRTDA
ncbi:MAG: chromosomal replication initiator protein DnaA [Syntrophobacterales bacterium]|jgi:chromosomal replication initiator protein|nr:chromosomal replication initiator protein DnaA [Syntrophobacterales bacterium]